jgi:uncharacterized protein
MSKKAATSRKDGQFRPVAVPDVDLGGFWGKWQDAVSDSTAEILLDRCEKAGMIKAIDVSQPNPGVVIPIAAWGGSTQMFWDSDLGKSIETIAYSLYRKPNPELEARADAIIDMYEKLQDEDGYLNAWFQRVQPDRRWTNLRDHHELYCAGHLIEAAVAYYQATGKRKLLDVMCRYVDYMLTVFGHGEGQIAGYCGHEEIELALVKLARVTGERKYLELSKFFVDERGISSPRKPFATAAIPRISTRRPMNMARPTSRCVTSARLSATPCAPCISIRAWPISPRSIRTTA